MFRFTELETLKNCQKVQKICISFLQIQICARDICTFNEGGGSRWRKENFLRNFLCNLIRFNIKICFSRSALTRNCFQGTVSVISCELSLEEEHLLPFNIKKFSYKFDTVLYQFLETGTSDITFMGCDQELKWSAFSLYPLPFFLYSPFKQRERSLLDEH